MYNMNIETKRQELASRLVDREVFYCVSSLVSTMSALAQSAPSDVLRGECLSWEDDILPLLERVDYDEAVEQYVEDADLSDLETLIDEDGCWEDFLEEKVFSEIGRPGKVADEDEPEEDWEDQDLEDWLDDDTSRWETLREKVLEFLTENSDFEELCGKHDIDTDDHRSEVYEHWIVSGWLARKLKEQGEITGDLCGLTIWGRCCTGQAICLDRNIQNLAIDLWREEYDEFVASQPKE